MTEREEVLQELGQEATQRRESKGITLEDVFDRTRIRMEYLQGIESGNYNGFPELVYVKGFVRTYLKLIGAEDLQDDFMEQLDRGNSVKKHEQNVNNILKNGSSFPEGFKPASHFWLFLVLLSALFGTGFYVWYAIAYGGIDLKNLKLFNFSGRGNEVVLNQPVKISSDIIEEVSGDEDLKVKTSNDVKSQDKKPAVPQRHFIQIQAINDVWLRVTIGSNTVYSRTMRKGDSTSWDLPAPATVLFGRPGAANVILNGKNLGVPNPSAKRHETYIYNPDGTFRKSSK